MLTIDADLPPGVLLPEGTSLDDRVLRLGGLWWSSEPALVTLDGAAVTALQPRTGEIGMRAVTENAGATRLPTRHGCPVIAGQAGVQAGLVADRRLPCDRLGLIVVFLADDPARQTLLAAQSDGAASTAVLGLRDGALSLKDRKAEAGLEVPLEGPGPQLAFVQLDAGQIALSADGVTFQTMPAEGAFAPGAVELFLGCVRQRAGLAMTLGPHSIADVIALPDCDLTHPDTAPLRAEFHRYATEIFTDGL